MTLPLASDVVDRVPRINHMAAYIKQAVRGKIIARKKYVTRNG